MSTPRSDHVAPDHRATPLAELWSLHGRTAVVTGGARGIGRATALRLAEAGAAVVVADIDDDGARAAAEEIAGVGGRGHGATVDVADVAAVEALADLAVSTFGGLDVWVNNVGIFPFATPLEVTGDEWDRVLTLDLRATFFGGQAAARRMAERARGVIVNIASTSSFRGREALPHYSAAKHGVLGVTKSLAIAYAPMGIRVLAVAPVFTDTSGAGPTPPPSNPIGVPMVFPLGRVGLPDDIARAVIFCASDLAAFMTGSTVVVDGGYLAV